MNELPKGWEQVKLSHVSQRITKGSTPTSYGFEYQDEGIAFVKIENIRNGLIEHQTIKHFISEEANLSQKRSILEAGDILFSIAGTIGATCLVHETDLPANTNQALAIIRGTSGVFHSGFLRYQLESEIGRKQSKQLERGGGMNNISLADVGHLAVAVPPLNEQRRIAARLEKLLSRVDFARTRLATIPRILKRFRQAVLAAASSGRLTNDWRRADSPGNGLPNSWDFVPLSKICRPKQWRTISTKELTSAGFPVYGANGRIGFYSEYNHEHPTILITCRGATCGTLNVSEPFSYVNGNAMALDDLDENMIAFRFALYALESRGFDDTITGSAQPQITRASLQIVELPIPPIPEQQEIVRRVEALFKTADALEARYRKAKAHVDKLRQSILAKAFRGELVPQDPNDEPASVLLERIRQNKMGLK